MRALCTFFATLLVLTSSLSRVALAQSDALTLDLQPPVIVLDRVDNGWAGEDQLFSAKVTDDRDDISVVLYHRLVGDTLFDSVAMQTSSDSDVYTVMVPTLIDGVRDIEYYLQAEDLAGNRAIKGFNFDPLIRALSVVNASVADTGGEAAGFDRKILWGLAGLLIVGLIASAAGSGGDDPSPSPGGPLTLEVNEIP